MTDTDARLIERLRVIRGIQFTPIENELVAEAADRIESLTAEVARLRERYEGVNAGSWFYPDGDTSSDACCNDAGEVLDEHYFDFTEPKTGVYPVERALGLPKIYAAVRAYSEEEKDERGSDDDYDATWHLTEAEARAALGDSK